MAKICDICGDPGVIEAIITCCDCKIATEHLYCMRVVRTQAPPFWRCEECEQKKSVSTRKKVEVKLKTQKVSVLMQKTTRVRSPIKNASATRFKFKERSVVTGRTKFITCEEAVKLSSGSRNTLRNPDCPGNERELKTANSELLPKSSPEKPATKTGSKNHDKVEAQSSARVEPSVTSALGVAEKHNLCFPVLHSYWKGNFYLPNRRENFNNAFKAHPPIRVPDKVYETLLKMPEDIYFELVPNHQVCMEIFSRYCPDNNDIGLYYFPRFKNRLDNISTIEFLWRENLVMKSIVNGVELLVFSSRLLQPHSQEFQGNSFLWGVFRCPKTVKVVADSRLLLEPKSEPCDDIPPGFEKIFKPCDDAPPGFEKIFKPCDDAPPGFENIYKPRG